MNPPQVILLTVCARIINIKVIYFLMYIARIYQQIRKFLNAHYDEEREKIQIT